MFILLNEKNEVIEAVDTVSRDGNGLLTTKGEFECYYPKELFDVEVSSIPEDFKPSYYLYEEGKFNLNPNYVSYKDPIIALEEEVLRLKADNETLKLMVADLGLMVGGGL